jgi:CRISPR-associated DxTHG motif protein
MKLIREEIEQVEIIGEQRNGKKNLYIEGVFLQGNIANRNKRMYDAGLLEREVKRYNENFVNKGRALGELGHPDGPSINLDRVSHKIVSLQREGDNFPFSSFKISLKVISTLPRSDSKRISISSRPSYSIWSELANINPELLESEPLYEEVFNVTWDDKAKMTPNLLRQWEQLLSEKLNTKIKLYLIDSNDREAEIIFDILYKEIPENTKEVYVDITHAFRHFPLVAAFSLPVLKYLKNFKTLQLIYGKLVNPPKPSPVIFMQTPTRLMELLEAVTLTENAGNFEKFADIFGIKHIKELYLKTETNRKISNNQFKKVAHSLQKNTYIDNVAADYLIQRVFREIKGKNLAERMAKRAVFFAKRNQFLKAYTLIYEAIIQTQPVPQVKGSKLSIYNERKANLRKRLNPNQRKIYNTIANIRHTITHGDDTNSPKIREIIQSEEKLRQWVYKGFDLVKELIKE